MTELFGGEHAVRDIVGLHSPSLLINKENKSNSYFPNDTLALKLFKHLSKLEGVTELKTPL